MYDKTLAFQVSPEPNPQDFALFRAASDTASVMAYYYHHFQPTFKAPAILRKSQNVLNAKLRDSNELLPIETLNPPPVIARLSSPPRKQKKRRESIRDVADRLAYWEGKQSPAWRVLSLSRVMGAAIRYSKENDSFTVQDLWAVPPLNQTPPPTETEFLAVIDRCINHYNICNRGYYVERITYGITHYLVHRRVVNIHGGQPSSKVL